MEVQKYLTGINGLRDRARPRTLIDHRQSPEHVLADVVKHPHVVVLVLGRLGNDVLDVPDEDGEHKDAHEPGAGHEEDLKWGGGRHTIHRLSNLRTQRSLNKGLL